MSTTVTFWGTGDSMGVPRVYCSCKVCEEARMEGTNKRLRSLVHLEDTEYGSMLIDCGPDWRVQMEAAGLKQIDRILITHSHFDHIAGIAEWADMCRWLKRKGDAYAMPDVISDIQSRFPWASSHINFHPIEGNLHFGGWVVACWKINHGKNGYAYAFRFDHPVSRRSWAYCSDSIALTEEQRQPLYGLDLLIFWTSFYKEPFPFETRSVYDVTEALELLVEWKPKRTLFTHLSHDIDLNHDYKLPSGAAFARAGLKVTV